MALNRNILSLQRQGEHASRLRSCCRCPRMSQSTVAVQVCGGLEKRMLSNEWTSHNVWDQDAEDHGSIDLSYLSRSEETMVSGGLSCTELGLLDSSSWVHRKIPWPASAFHFSSGRRRWDSQSGKTKFPEIGQVILPEKSRSSKTNIPFYLKLMKVFWDMPRNPGVCWFPLQLQLGDTWYPLNEVLGVNRVLQDFSMRTLSFSVFVRAGFSLRSCIKQKFFSLYRVLRQAYYFRRA